MPQETFRDVVERLLKDVWELNKLSRAKNPQPEQSEQIMFTSAKNCKIHYDRIKKMDSLIHEALNQKSSQ